MRRDYLGFFLYSVLLGLAWCRRSYGSSEDDNTETQTDTPPSLPQPNSLSEGTIPFQALIPQVPLPDAFDLGAQVSSRGLWRMHGEFSSIVGLLVYSFSNHTEPTASTATICRQLRSQVYRSAPLDDIFFGFTANTELGCRGEIPQSVIGALLELVKRAIAEPPASAEILNTHDDGGHTLDTETQSPADLTPWVGIYKAVAVLDRLNPEDWAAQRDRLSTALVNVLHPALLGKAEELETSMVLEMMDLFLSFAAQKRPTGTPHQRTLDMIDAFDMWWERGPSFPTTRSFASGVHALAIDAMIRRITKHRTSPLLPWIASTLYTSADAVATASDGGVSARAFSEAALLLLSFTSRGAFHALFPLSPSDVKINAGRAAAVIRPCQKEMRGSSNVPVCAEIRYCPLFPNMFPFVANNRAQVTALVHTTTGPELTAHQLEAEDYSTTASDADAKDSCTSLGVYRFSVTPAAFRVQGLLVELFNDKLEHTTQPTHPHHAALLTSSYLTLAPCLDGKEISIARSLNSSVRFPRHPVPVELSPMQELAVNISTLPLLTFDLSLSYPTGDRMIGEKQLPQKSLTVGTTVASPAPEFVALLVEAVDTPDNAQQPIYAPTHDAALQRRPFGAPSSTMILATPRRAARNSMYTIKFRMRQLEEILYLGPESRLRLTILVGSADTGARLQRELGIINFSTSKQSDFVRHPERQPAVIGSPDGQFYSVIPTEAFWHPKSLLHYHFQDASPRPSSVVTALFLASVVITPVILLSWMIPKTGLTLRLRHITFWHLMFTVSIVFVASGLLLYWVKWKLLYFLKCLLLSAPVAVLLGNRSLSQRRAMTYHVSE